MDSESDPEGYFKPEFFNTIDQLRSFIRALRNGGETALFWFVQL
jgi:hypothetical protein